MSKDRESPYFFSEGYAYTIFGAFESKETAPFDAPLLTPDADGGFSCSFTVRQPVRELLARWNQQTGEMTLETREGAVVLATRDPYAFHAGMQLLRQDALVMFMGWMLLRAPAP